MNREVNKQVNALTHEIIGAVLEVHRALGPGFLETVYEEAICHELKSRKIPFARQFPVKLKYKEINVGDSRLDLFADQLVVVELKSVEMLAPIHIAQVISYLKATHADLGLIINFNVPVLKLGIKRVIYSHLNSASLR